MQFFQCIIFPVGMELFGAANEEQWQIISETIDSSEVSIFNTHEKGEIKAKIVVDVCGV